MTRARCDLLVIGGGIHGAAIARDAAGRGLTVVLVERGDLASGTSSASSKLIHGGLRYLEQGRLGLVREALRERARLLAERPHLVRPLRLVLPCAPGGRPAWQLRAGLFLYDRLGGARDLPRSEAVRLREDPAGAPLHPAFTRGFAFYDAWTDDARLVMDLALDAAELGAEIRTRVELLRAERGAGAWRVLLQERDPDTGEASGAPQELEARALVNAGGPWAMEIARRIPCAPLRARLRLVQGSHLIVPRWYAGEHAWLLQNEDRRVVFVLPWREDETLIGTTEIPLAEAPAAARVRAEEVESLCRAVARYFPQAPRPSDVRASFAGVRPLFDDGSGNPSRVTRDRRLLLDAAGPPVLHALGGKLTTHRALAAAVLDQLARVMPGIGPAWTHHAPEAPRPTRAALAAEVRSARPELTAAIAAAWAARHGPRARALAAAAAPDATREILGADLTCAEVVWCVQREWARTAEDLLLRRLGGERSLDAPARARLTEWLRDARAARPARP